MPAQRPLESLADLRITSFIAHIVDHRSGSLKLSGLETPVGEGFPHDFFKQYILRALSDPLRRRACFRPGSGVVSGAAAALRAGSRSFVEASQAIASRLYTVMGESRYNRLIKPGDIMVALFRDAAEGNAGPEYMAILKIDPSDAIIRRAVQVDGKQQVIFETREDRIPAVEENKIQKIALLGERQPDPEPHDLVILDNNIKQVGVAHFFYDDFLESWLNPNPVEVTQLIMREVKRFVSKRPDVVSPPLAARERVSIVDGTAALLRRGVPVDLQTVAQHAVRNLDRSRSDKQAIRGGLVDHLSSRGRPEERIAPQQVVPVSPATVDAETATLTYVVDGGIQITGAADQMQERVQISPPDAAGIMTITIRTQLLEVS